MYMYLITFLGGSTMKVRANSPKEAWNNCNRIFGLEVISVRWLR